MLDPALNECMDRIEACSAEALQAARAGSAPEELRQSLEMLHQQALLARQSGEGAHQDGQDAAMRNNALQMERTADRALECCGKPAGAIDPGAQEAVQRLHDAISNLKNHILGQPQLH